MKEAWLIFFKVYNIWCTSTGETKFEKLHKETFLKHDKAATVNSAKEEECLPHPSPIVSDCREWHQGQMRPLLNVFVNFAEMFVQKKTF